MILLNFITLSIAQVFAKLAIMVRGCSVVYALHIFSTLTMKFQVRMG